MTDQTSDKSTRGRVSKIDKLPEDIRKPLNQMLRNPNLSQLEILELINAEILAAGLPEECTISRSGLNRYASQIEQAGAKIRQAREITDALCAQFGDKPTTEIGKGSIELLRSMVFDITLKLANNQDVEPKTLNQLALAMNRLETAAMASHKREVEIRKAFAQEAANAAEVIAVEQGLTAEGVAALKREILGIA